MDHKDWIKTQFEKYVRRCYRDVLIHTSFVETVARKEAEEENFYCAIKILRANNKYDQDRIDEIDELRNKRNKILHELLKDKKLDKNLIDLRIKQMKDLLKEIYHNSSFIQRYFKKEYGIDTKKFK